MARKRRVPAPASGPRKLPVIESSYLEALTTGMVASFINERIQICGLAPKTGNRFRQIIGTLINWAVSQRGVRLPGGINPAKGVRRYKEPAPTIRFLRLPEIAQQLAVFKDRPLLQTLVAVYIYGGLRREEALWLTLDDVDLERKLIHVRAKHTADGFWQPKTGVNRVVPIGSDLRGYLAAYVPPTSAGRWMFPSPTGKHWDPDNLSQDIRAANGAVGLPWGCLDFRHTFGSQLASAGRSLHQIAKFMGNSPEICRRHYAALVPEEMHAVVEFPKMVAGAGGPTTVAT